MELLEDNLNNAEKLLLKTIKNNHVHLTAMYMLLAVQEGLGRSKLVVQKTAKKILVIDPDDENCKKLIIKKKSKENINQKLKLKSSKNKKLNKKEISRVINNNF